MDELANAVLSAQLADTSQAERWFALVCKAYEESAAAEESWKEFRGRLTGAAAGEGFSAEAENFAEYMEAATSAPLDIVATMNDQGAGRLADMYAAKIATDTAAQEVVPAEDQDGWNAYLAANGPTWDGTEDAWQQFRAWFLYQAAQARVGRSAEAFIGYVEAQRDKIAAFTEYGVTIGAQPSADSPESAGTADPASFPELSEGDSGQWVDYLDSMLRSRGF